MASSNMLPDSVEIREFVFPIATPVPSRVELVEWAGQEALCITSFVIFTFVGGFWFAVAATVIGPFVFRPFPWSLGSPFPSGLAGSSRWVRRSLCTRLPWGLHAWT
jgi:hypothetical protein